MEAEVGDIDIDLLIEQMEILRRVVDGKEVTLEERDKLKGALHTLHEIYDGF